MNEEEGEKAKKGEGERERERGREREREGERGREREREREKQIEEDLVHTKKVQYRTTPNVKGDDLKLHSPPLPSHLLLPS